MLCMIYLQLCVTCMFHLQIQIHHFILKQREKTTDCEAEIKSQILRIL